MSPTAIVRRRRQPARRARTSLVARTTNRPPGLDPDRETRTRLLTEAQTLFAARGFRHVTVREICAAANANVAAVNYHFGDKRGLYREVLDGAVAVMQRTTEQARTAGEGGDAEHRLRAYTRVFLHAVGQSHDSWIHRLMLHEMAEPTDALDLIVDEVIAPRIAYMSELVADILVLEVGDERVLHGVLSVQSQFHAAMGNPVARRLEPRLTSDPAALDRLAEHIASFSVGGMRSIRPATRRRS
jgi:AcrR family transcriptional regulator